MNVVTTAPPQAHASRHRRFRIAVIVLSALAAVIGSVLLATRDGEDVTTRGISAVVRVPGHPGSVAAGPNALWVALRGDPNEPAADRPLLRLDLATGTVVRTVHLGGEASDLTRVGDRLVASVEPVGGSQTGARRLVVLRWRDGAVLPLGQSHLDDADARAFDGPVDRVLQSGNALWALETRPARLLRLDASTLTPYASIALSHGSTLGLASGEGYLWVTAGDAGEVLRVDPVTHAIRRLHVGGFPVGILVTGGQVWVTDRSRGRVLRLDPRRLQPIGEPIHVGAKPTWLAVAGRYLFVSDQDAGTIARVDLRLGRKVGPPIRIAPRANDAVAPALASSGESVWVSSFAAGTVTRITSPGSLGALSSAVTLKGTGNGPVNPGPSGTGVTDGGVAGTGHVRITGAIDDQGTYVGYRTVIGQIAKVRTVVVGKKGTITFPTTIHLGTESLAPWTITSGTRSYRGVHGEGRLTVDNYESNPYTFVMQGTLSR